MHNFIRLQQNGIQISPRLLSTEAEHAGSFLDVDAKKFMNQFRDQLANDIWEYCSTWYVEYVLLHNANLVNVVICVNLYDYNFSNK